MEYNTDGTPYPPAEVGGTVDTGLVIAAGPGDTSPTIGNIAAAMAKVQAVLKSPKRNRKVTVRGTSKSGKAFNYDFEYATFDTILDAVRKPMSDNGLAFIQRVITQPRLSVETLLMHESGEWIRGMMPAQLDETKSGSQAVGSAVSYAKRYGFCALIGVAADMDDDANMGDGNTVRESSRAAPKSPDEKDQDAWGGPLGKVALKKAIGEILQDVDGATDTETLFGIINAPHFKEIEKQAKADLPTWWLGKDGSEILGAEERIEKKFAELEAANAAESGDEAEDITAPLRAG